MPPLLLIDGDQFLFRGVAAVEHEVRWDDQNHVLVSNVEEAWDTVERIVERLFAQFKTRDHVMCFSCPNEECFRREVSQTYKMSRVATRKPMCFFAVKERLLNKYNPLDYKGLEADDVMGILATKPGDRERIIVSQDKDMRSIPGKLWRTTDGRDGAIETISQEAAGHFHMYQTLAGDVTDGYAGCPGAGEKGVTEFLANPYVWTSYLHKFKSGERKDLSETRWTKEALGERPLWEAVVSWFEKAGLDEAEALKQARLARILRWSDWNSETKTPILWSPNGA